MQQIDAGVVLAFDTASTRIALACARNEKGDGAPAFLAAADQTAPRKANKLLVPQIAELFSAEGLTSADISCVVCGKGPGSFTGVRIGVATAKGIATALRVPLHGVSTIDAVAWGLWRSGVRGAVGVAADAMRGEVYPVRYQLTEQGPERQNPDIVSKPAPVAAQWAAEAVRSGRALTVAGDGLAKHLSAFEAAFDEAEAADLLVVADQEQWFATGRGLLDAFAADGRAGRLDSGVPGDLLPVYTRLSDAEENERRRLGMAQDQARRSGVADDAALGGLVLVPMSVTDAPTVLELDQALVEPLLPPRPPAPDIDPQIAAELAQSGCAACLASRVEEVHPTAPLQRDSLFDSLTRPDESWWIAREKGEVIGYAGIRVSRGTAALLRVAVVREARRQGVAAQLLQRVTHDALDLGAAHAAAKAPEQAPGVRALLAATGFAVGDNGMALAELPLPQFTHHQQAPADDPVVAGMDLGDSVRHEAEAGQVSAPHPLILAIESSCDETAAAIIDDAEQLHADVVASQIDFHARFGGVVPEIASRKHTEAICGVVDEALARAGEQLGRPAPLDFSDLDAIAVTVGPGLVGALVVGVAFAKGAAWASGLPLIGVNHLEGHLYANRLIDPEVKPPLVALLVSGGNTMLVHARDWGDYEVLGSTLDDAVGEAFDKVAKALGLGYPGGPVISRLAKEGNPRAIRFPRAMLHSHDYRFSLSGLKTAVITYIHQANDAGRAINLPDLAASFQAAVVDVLVAKAKAAVEQTGVDQFCLGGGVAANPELRHDLARALKRLHIKVTLPPFSACTDNAGMIGAVARERYHQEKFEELSVDVQPGMDIEEPY